MPPDLPPDAAEPSTSPEPDVRFSFANERTFLAWNRTALALITAGLAITQLLPPFGVEAGRRIVGLPLVGLGVLVSLASLHRWQANEAAIRERRPLPRSIVPAATAVVIAASALTALAFVVLGSR